MSSDASNGPITGQSSTSRSAATPGSPKQPTMTASAGWARPRSAASIGGTQVYSSAVLSIDSGPPGLSATSMTVSGPLQS